MAVLKRIGAVVGVSIVAGGLLLITGVGVAADKPAGDEKKPPAEQAPPEGGKKKAPENEKKPAQPPAVGDKAEDFTLQTLEKKDVKLSERLKDGPAVVVFLRGWPGYQCPLCTRQFGELLSRASDLKATGASVIANYPGPADKLREHAKEFLGGKEPPAPITLVTDEDMKVVKQWNLRWEASGETAYPSTFVVDKGGVVRWAKVSKAHGGRSSAQEVIDAVKGLKKE